MKPGQPHNEKTLILPKVGEEYVHGERKARPHRWIPPTIWHAPLSPFCYKGNLLSPVPIRLQTSAPFRCSIAQTQYALPYYTATFYNLPEKPPPMDKIQSYDDMKHLNQGRG
ncbi:hypothetical protein PGTUg99_026990 [Puccinia graminis f. sp. tritici]|uniref:Uncharacterized protein n=1 Tax=Puccinia graminis f. sp. tritici TaxID=56615 RepID=A0A5B0SEI6_PUCGR|nr:hypothetical protein PGTUg99_026990 [Puccinia graminis f. sp. tritici]